MIENVKIRQGATYEATLTDDDLTADTLTLTVSDSDGFIVGQEVASYTTVESERVATVTLDTTPIEVGDYFYMFTIEYSDGHVEKLPDPTDTTWCDTGECTLPEFIICEANDIESSS